MKSGIAYDSIFFSWNTYSNQGEIKFIFKSNDEKDERSELIGTSECKDNVPKLSTKHFKNV